MDSSRQRDRDVMPVVVGGKYPRYIQQREVCGSSLLIALIFSVTNDNENRKEVWVLEKSENDCLEEWETE